MELLISVVTSKGERVEAWRSDRSSKGERVEAWRSDRSPGHRSLIDSWSTQMFRCRSRRVGRQRMSDGSNRTDTQFQPQGTDDASLVARGWNDGQTFRVQPSEQGLLVPGVDAVRIVTLLQTSRIRPTDSPGTSETDVRWTA